MPTYIGRAVLARPLYLKRSTHENRTAGVT
jgi:hypothetical protein